jgi:hypothetical protein
MVLVIATLTLVISALVHADETGILLIGVGLIAILMLGPDRVRLWREEHGAPTTRRRPWR